jgi:hypothetical protein
MATRPEYADPEVRAATRMLLRCDQPQLRPSDLMEFALDIENLNSAVDMLIFCSTKQTWSALCEEFIYRRSLRRLKMSNIVRFLVMQELLSYSRRMDDRESVLKSIPHAVDELIYRIAHDGRPSPRSVAREPCFEDESRLAEEKLNAVLIAAGYHSADRGGAGAGAGGRRLRVVR